MGMFDHIHDYKLMCPYCNSYCKLEIQTKDYDCALDTIDIKYPEHETKAIFRFVQRNYAKTRVREVEAIGVCYSPICNMISRACDFIRFGRISGFGRGFDLVYATDKSGVAIGPASSIAKLDNVTSADIPAIKKCFLSVLRKAPANVQESFARAMKGVGNEWGLAVLSWGADNIDAKWYQKASVTIDKKVLHLMGVDE